MRVLLIQPGQDEAMGLQRLDCVEPLGLEMIAAAIQEQCEVALLDLRLDSDALSSTLTEFQPHVVGISSSFTTNIYEALGVAEAAKSHDSHTFVVLGGHHPSLQPEDFHHPAVDALVIGEGEYIMRELVNCLSAGDDPSQVAGLVLNRSEGQHFTGQRALLEDLDDLPYPDRSLTSSYRQDYHLFLTGPVATLETARGCPYTCRFCAVWQFYRRQVRFKSPERIIGELEAIDEPVVFITDDNFFADVQRAGEIGRRIRERGIRKRYSIQARSDAIVRQPQIVAQWREIGLEGIFIGFEKPGQAELETLNKHNSVENNERALQILRQHGIEPMASFIVDPDYGHDEFAALRAYVRRLELRRPAFAVLTPLPGTALFERMRERLTTIDYEHFDLLHAVLPTRLPLVEFYEELSSLYREAYPRWKLGLARIYLALRTLWPGDRTPPGWWALLTTIWQMGDPQTYMQGESEAPESGNWG